jgi:TonB family protein
MRATRPARAIDFPLISGETRLEACLPPHNRRRSEQDMFPQRISRFEFRPDESLSDPSHILEQHILAGFPRDLALDLVLNEIMVRAAEATRANAAALALVRGNDDNDLVCRAATGSLAPGLGIPLNPRDGLSGACLQSREPQLSVETESDPRVDPDVSRRLGIRSILAVPVFDTNDSAKFTGVLEVFSSSPAAFGDSDQKLLQVFAEECARVRQVALELDLSKPVSGASGELNLPTLLPADFTPSDFTPPDFTVGNRLTVRRSPYETWALVLGVLTILSAIALSFLIGSRIGWPSRPRSAPSSSHVDQPVAPEQPSAATRISGASQSSSERSLSRKAGAEKSSSQKAAKQSSSISTQTSTPVTNAGDLVVYERGKLVFRLKPDSDNQINHAVTEATSTAKLAPGKSVRLNPEQAEALLQKRVEPQYPAAALAAHQAGDVVMEVQVAEDGSVAHIRLLSGDPVLAAAATEAVRNWRYQPYLQGDHAFQFQTKVTLTFTLPN